MVQQADARAMNASLIGYARVSTYEQDLGVNGAIAIFAVVLVVGALIAWGYAARAAAKRA